MPEDSFANLTAAFEAVEAVKATFTVDPNKGYFPDEGTATSIEKVGEYTIEALFTEKAPVDKTAKAVFKITDPKAAIFTGIGSEISFGHIEDNNYKISVLPELTINPGYTLSGWEVVDATGTVWKTFPADATEIEVNGPGNYTINVLFEEQERINAYFSVIQTDKGHIKDSTTNFVAFEDVTNKKSITLPIVEAENGWKFVGWSCGGTNVVIPAGKELCTFDELKQWATFTEGSKLGFAGFEAVFEKN